MGKYFKPQIIFTNENSKTLETIKVLQNKHQVQHMNPTFKSDCKVPQTIINPYK